MARTVCENCHLEIPASGLCDDCPPRGTSLVPAVAAMKVHPALAEAIYRRGYLPRLAA